ncbi:histidine kinase [hot springs metagenome]|uniref:histidine kinase n=1 Tax=hot springs metagenome TaxID=433727 RepID=A0A5J4L118_9ZZZZ
MSDLLKKIKEMRISLSTKLIIGCSVTLILALGISFYIIAHRQERLIMGQVENEARAIFKQIVITRKWIADHGGIFVEKLPWIKPTPYIKDSEVRDVQGKRYVRETPAMVTKELSKYAKDKGLYWFHITSLKLINPGNAPDDFERNALNQFEKASIKELISIEKIDNSRYLRYISPLYVEEACLQCHAKQGYKLGDVRGAISITIPMDKTFAEIASNRQSMLLAAIITVLALISAMFFMLRKIVMTPMKRLKSAIDEFSEGKYFPSKRLKTGDEFEDLCNAFSQMAGTLTDYHTCLNNKIKDATRGLEETNRKLIETNRLLNEANIKKSDFIARASHELRTPLTSIKGAMDYISAKLSSYLKSHHEESALDDLHIFFDVIKKNSERLIRMVNTMLDIERIEMGASELRFSDINLSYLIAEVLAYLQINADKKGIFFNANIPNNIIVSIDEDRIKQVLINLLSNAIKFAPEESEILIFAYPEKDYAIVEIWDEGPGIHPSEHEKIFEKFYRNGNKEGTGLGLAICKSIIEAHNGIIGVNSDGKNGSCFYFKLPYTRGHHEGFSQEGFNRTEQHKLLEIAKKIATPC